MHFGLSNAPASFQGYINKILAKKLDIFVVVCLDDLLIYTEDLGQPHVDVVWWVLEQLRKYGLYANLKNCRFFEDKVQFLGFVISAQGIRIEEEKIEIVGDWPKPLSVRDIQVFLGFANFYRRFIKKFRRIAMPLISMLKTTDKSIGNASQSILTNASKKKQGILSSVDSGGVDENIKNLSSIIKSAKSKKPNFA